MSEKKKIEKVEYVKVKLIGIVPQPKGRYQYIDKEGLEQTAFQGDIIELKKEDADALVNIVYAEYIKE